jgi:hypothetical protein
MLFPSVCMGILELSDFESELSRWNIATQVTEY